MAIQTEHIPLPAPGVSQALGSREPAHRETTRHRLAFPAYPTEVVEAGRNARRAMRWPMMISAGLLLLALTATVAFLVIIRPTAAAGALLVTGALLLLRTWRPGRTYDSSVGWVYRFGILGGVSGELLAQTVLQVGASPVPSWPWLATDALGIGGAIGLGVALATSSAVLIVSFLHGARSLLRIDRQTLA